MSQKTDIVKIKKTPPQYIRILKIVRRIYHVQAKKTIVHALNVFTVNPLEAAV